MTNAGTRAVTNERREHRRWYVHLALMLTLAGSLLTLIYLSHSITAHVVLGVAFMVMVTVHLYQRRRTIASLARRLWRGPGGGHASKRLAVADAALVLLVLNVLVSGVVDALHHQATQLSFLATIGFPPGLIQWHKLASLAASVDALVHIVRRRRRLRHSRIQ